MAPPLIDGYGVSSGFEIYLQDRVGGDITELYDVGQAFIAALMERPEIGSAYTTFNVNFPQYLVEVDAAKCQRAGTTADAVLSTLAGYYSGQYVSNFNRFNKLYRVMIQSSPEYRVTPESLDRTFTRVGDGKMAPLSQFVKLTKVYGPESLTRFNLYSSMGINGEAAPGYSSGDAIQAIREVVAENLPRGYGYEFAGISREESQTSSNTAVIFLICTVFVYLILCGLYESFFVPFAVILSVPFGLMGSFLFAKLMGLENNTDLGIARLRVKEAEATLFSSRLAYLPSLNLAPQGEVSSYDGAEAAKTYNLAVSAGWELDLFGKLTNAARAAFYPSITLSGSAGWTNNSGTAIVNPGNWLLSAISSLTQLLFNRGQNIANLRIAKAQQEEALLSFKQSLLKAGSEVNDALVQWQVADARLVVVGEQVETLQSAVEHTRKLMEYSSRSSYLEVLTAQQSLLLAELAEANDRFDKIQGVINLYHALGGGAE